MKDTLTTGEIAKYCGVNFRTVIRWIEKGYMKSYKLPGRGDNRVPYAEFITFLEKNNMPIPSDIAENTAKEAASTILDNKPVKNSVEGGAAKSRVLIIEDEKNMSNAMKRVLLRAGYEVEIALNGVVAGMKLQSFMPNLITLDLQMPGMSGFEVLDVMKANEEFDSVKVLIVSAAEKAKLAQVMTLGADDLLEKPFENQLLIEKVRDLLK